MKERTLVSPNLKEWRDYLKSQMDSWPEWKKATSSYSYVPLVVSKRKEEKISEPAFAVFHNT